VAEPIHLVGSRGRGPHSFTPALTGWIARPCRPRAFRWSDPGCAGEHVRVVRGRV